MLSSAVQAMAGVSRKGANEFRRRASTPSADARRVHRYFDGLGMSILLTLMESPFSSPVRLTVCPAWVRKSAS